MQFNMASENVTFVHGFANKTNREHTDSENRGTQADSVGMFWICKSGSNGYRIHVRRFVSHVRWVFFFPPLRDCFSLWTCANENFQRYRSTISLLFYFVPFDLSPLASLFYNDASSFFVRTYVHCSHLFLSNLNIILP